MLKMISFWDGDEPVVALTYYATHPQSYYRTGLANPDFPGMARDQRQKATGVPHIHFDGAGGNIGAGQVERRLPREPPGPGRPRRRRDGPGLGDDREDADRGHGPRLDVDRRGPAGRPAPRRGPAPGPILEDPAAKPSRERAKAANDLVWLRRCKAGDTIDVACLRLGKARVLHLPGELFVEYQLAAQKLRPDLFVAMAAYGDYAPGYIGTEIAYSQGGYETGPRPRWSRPKVERVLMDVIGRLLRE